MATLWRLEGFCYISRTAAGLHEVLLFTVSKGQSSKDFPYTKWDWPSQQSLEPGRKKVQHLSLVGSSNVLPTPLHLRLWMKQGQHVVTSLRNTQEAVIQKSKRVVFIGPQIHKLFRDKQFKFSDVMRRRRGMVDG